MDPPYWDGHSLAFGPVAPERLYPDGNVFEPHPAACLSATDISTQGKPYEQRRTPSRAADQD